MYSFFMSQDEELYYSLKFKNKYILHHKDKNMMVNIISFKQFHKILNQSTTDNTYDYMFNTYEGDQQIKEVKIELLIQQYEMFKMKSDEDIETIF